MGKEKGLEPIQFDGYSIRRIWDEETGQWWFAVVDVIEALTESRKPRDYWYRMKRRVDENEGIELSTICRQFKMKAPNNRLYETECADAEGMLRIIQSIPSPRAEPFKRWLAKVGYEPAIPGACLFEHKRLFAGANQRPFATITARFGTCQTVKNSLFSTTR